MKKHLKLFIFIMIIIFTPKVFAASYNVTNKIKSNPSDSGGTFSAIDISSGIAIPGVYNVNTRYNGVLNEINFYIYNNDWDWQYNKTYTITLSMATEDWRNHFMGPVICDANLNGSCWSSSVTKYVNGSFRFISQKKISFNIKTGGNIGAYLKFTIYSGSGTTGMTGVTNFNLNGVTISTTTTVTPSPVPSTPTPTPAPTPTPQPNNQDIINNQTQNTQDIINNNNSNTNTIINNQTQNTQDIIDNQSQNTSDIIENNNATTEQLIETMKDNNYPSCQNGYRNFLVGSDKSYLSNNTGRVSSNSNYFITQPIRIKENLSYTLDLVDPTGIQYGYYCFYKKDNTRVSCVKYSDNTTTSYTFTAPANSYYVIFTLYRRNNVMLNATLKGTTCVSNEYESQIIDFKQFLNEVSTNDFITDDSNPNIQDNEFTSLFDSVSITNPLDSLLQLPVQFINAIVNQSNSCQVVNLGTLLGVSITLPCIDIGSIIGSSVWNTIDVLSSIGLIVLILKQLYESITNALTLGGYMDAKKGGLGYMSPLEFLCSIFTGFGGDNI